MTKYYELPQTFKEWRQFAFYTLDDCTRIFHVNRRTVNNWESGKTEPPRAVLICLQLFCSRLDFLGKQWQGFRITPECIESPEGDFLRPGEIRAFTYAMQAMNMRRDRRCRMNDNDEPGTPNFNKVTFIDEKKRDKSIKKSAKDDTEKPDKSSLSKKI